MTESEKNDKEDFQRHLAAAQQGDSDSYYSVGCFYAEGRGVEADYDAAVYWLQKAVDNDDMFAEDELEKVLKWQKQSRKKTDKNSLKKIKKQISEGVTFDFQENRQIRIFISSTFKDMMKERDYLITKVFPELRNYCEDRDISLFELDLRWGVTQEESETQMTFKICLNEVDNTRPFFIGLLGERYGWVPDNAAIDKMKTTNVFEEYQWLMEELKKNKSVTEVEMIEGAFLPEEDINAYFYIRSPNMHTPDEFIEPKGSDSEKNLFKLKEKIKNDPRYDYNEYESLEELGQQVEEDFKDLIDEYFPEKKILSDAQNEDIKQYIFLKSKLRSYVTNPDWMNTLDEFADCNENILAVTGESGTGKGSLLAAWIADRYKKNNENEKIIFHFIGISKSEGALKDIIFRLMNNIYNSFNLYEKDLHFNYMQTANFKNLLSVVPEDKKLIIILDSLDLLNNINSKKLEWIPDNLPGNVKFIFSSSTGDETAEVLKRRADKNLLLTPLPVDIKQNLIKEYFKKFSKKLTPAQADRIISDKKCEKPFAMAALLDNLRMFGNFDKFDSQIDERLAFNDIESLFDFFLVNIESLFKKDDMVKDMLSIIAVSRRGLTETEILNITKIPGLYWSQLSNCMSIYLITINGIVRFSSPFMHNAVKNRYLKDDERKARELISQYMEKRENIKLGRVCEELAYQLMELKEFDRLYNFLLDIDVFTIMNKNVNELASYWRALHKQDKTLYPMEKILEANKDVDFLIIGDIQEFNRDILCDYQASLYFALKSLENLTQLYGKDRVSSGFYNEIGECYMRVNDYKKAVDYLKLALKDSEKKQNRETSMIYDNISSCYENLGESEKAADYKNKAYEIKKIVLKEENLDYNETYESYVDSGLYFYTSGNYARALGYFNIALDISVINYGEADAKTIAVKNYIKICYENNGDQGDTRN